ncbi:hypothetical protein [Novipirellula artificiosorum]|nr:hypothetical protein [Novipirellula artificiosorum]
MGTLARMIHDRCRPDQVNACCAGGNGQATMRVVGEDLVWTNTVYDMDGKKTVSDFVYQKQDARTMLVKYTDAEDGKQKTVKCTKIGD